MSSPLKNNKFCIKLDSQLMQSILSYYIWYFLNIPIFVFIPFSIKLKKVKATSESNNKTYMTDIHIKMHNKILSASS